MNRILDYLRYAAAGGIFAVASAGAVAQPGHEASLIIGLLGLVAGLLTAARLRLVR